MIQALRAYEEEHPETCEELPSGDEFYGVAKGKNHLEKYIQWVYVPAVKDASSEQAEAKATALGKLLGTHSSLQGQLQGPNRRYSQGNAGEVRKATRR